MTGVIAYGAGNQRSVTNALDTCGEDWTIVTSPAHVRAVSRLVLPGVGHFGGLMQFLAQSGLDESIKRWLCQGNPLLGICLGMQALFDSSEEAPGVPGLGIISGSVLRFPNNLRCPHMGWNTVQESGKPDSWMYFAHSYFVEPNGTESAITHHGITIASIVRKGSAIGFQFHPEKSAKAGSQRLKEWLHDAG